MYHAKLLEDTALSAADFFFTKRYFYRFIRSRFNLDAGYRWHGRRYLIKISRTLMNINMIARLAVVTVRKIIS